MEDFTNLIKYLKVCFENIFNLHHNIVSANYYADHEKMAEYYELILDITDSLTENAIAIELKEPTIRESILAYQVLDTEQRQAKECYELVSEYFSGIIGLMEDCKNELPDYLKNKLEEYQEKLAIECNFKIKHLLEA